MTEYFLNNEVRAGQDARTAGDIEVFASRDDVELHFEPWYVDETYLLLRSDGRRQLITALSGRICVIDAGDATDYRALAREFLVQYLANIGEAAVTRQKYSPEIAEVDWGNMSTEALFKIALLFKHG
jgi:hypothetical protein